MHRSAPPSAPVPGRFPSRGAIAAALLVLIAAAASPAGAALAPAQVTGKWLGTIGTPRERITVGLDFRRAPNGDLKLYLTQPVMNYFAIEAPGVVKLDGDTLRLPEMAMTLALRDGRLEGFYPGPNSPGTFTRAASLPREVPIPRVPAGPGPRWTTRLNGQVYASPVVAESLVFVGTTGGVMNALRVADGSLKWAFGAGRPIHGDALVTGEAVYFACDNGYLFKLERATGKETWRYDLGDARVSRVLPHPGVYDWDWQGPKPVIADGVVYVGAGDGGFHAVDAATGARLWRFETKGKIRNGAALDGRRVIVGSADRFVYALDRASGRELWKADTRAEVDATPVVHDGKVLVGNRGAGLIAFEAETGKQLWRNYFWGSWVESTPVVVDGTIYIGASDLRRASAIHPDDGRVLWRTDVHGWNWGTPLVTADRVYVGAAGGTPYVLEHVASFNVLDRATGRLLRRWPLPASAGAHQWGIGGSPAPAGDLVIVTTIEGSVMAFPAR